MLRHKTETGWYLITHPDHARLAGAVATHWGNDLFLPPEPRASVLHAIHVHDDGWLARDASPAITREGKPSAFSTELVGMYSAFEEIDLADYLAVRERAVEDVEAEDAYAALLVSMHTVNLLTERADRATIAAAQLPLLDAFLDRQHQRQHRLRAAIRANPRFTPQDGSDETIQNNFRLLQACDNLSLLSCVAYPHPATLLHPLPTRNGSPQTIAVTSPAPRAFRLDPYPLDTSALTLNLPTRHIEGHIFPTAGHLRRRFTATPATMLSVVIQSR